MKTGFLYDDVFLRHEAPAGHPERPERLTAIVEALRKSSFWSSVIHVRPRKALPEEVMAVHTERYVDKVLKLTGGHLDPDTYISPGSAEAALFAAGAVIEAIDRCRKNEVGRAFCAVRPPGHHAEADRAMGFCLFNNVAVGARYAQRAGYGKVFIVDFDVHHGNGTQHMFEEDDSVFYFSTHQFPHYPGTGSASEKGKGRGEGFTHNIPMADGSGDKEYLAAYRETLPGLVKGFSPDIVLVSAGYDIHHYDPLASIRVTDEGVRGIVQGILSFGLPTVFSLEGGYDLHALARSVIITIEEMLKG